MVTPESTCFPSRSQDTEICLGLKPVAWQRSLDVRGPLPVLEKPSRGGTKTVTLGGTSSGTVVGRRASAWPGPTPARRAEGRRLCLTCEGNFHVFVTGAVLDTACHELIQAFENVCRGQEQLGGGQVLALP